MNFKRFTLISLFLLILLLGSASASEDNSMNEISDSIDEDMQDLSISETIIEEETDNTNIQEKIIENDASDSAIEEDELIQYNPKSKSKLGYTFKDGDVDVYARNKTTIITNKNDSRFVNKLFFVKVPKGVNGNVCIWTDNDVIFEKKLSKISTKTTKKGFTTYTIHLTDLKYFPNICNFFRNKETIQINLAYNGNGGKNTNEAKQYTIYLNKKAKTFKLKHRQLVEFHVLFIDFKSGKPKKYKAWLKTSKTMKPVVGRKIKVSINGVKYVRTTNSKGMISIYPPKYLAPKDFQKTYWRFDGDEKYCEWSDVNTIQVYKNPKSSKSKITAKPKTFNLNATKKYSIKLTSKGKAIKKAKLSLRVKGEKYVAKTDSKGKATFNLSKLTKKGKFTATIVYLGDKTHYMTYKNIKLAVKD